MAIDLYISTQLLDYGCLDLSIKIITGRLLLTCIYPHCYRVIVLISVYPHCYQIMAAQICLLRLPQDDDCWICVYPHCCWMFWVFISVSDYPERYVASLGWSIVQEIRPAAFLCTTSILYIYVNTYIIIAVYSNPLICSTT